MVKFYNYDIVFAEVPEEVTLAINITGCPNRCPGCHSTHLLADEGDVLDEEALEVLLSIYGKSITCLSFMGGDARPGEINALAAYMKATHPGIKTAWYSGRENLSKEIEPANFNYIKLGPWIEERGPLSSPSTNQRMFQIQENGDFLDITYKMLKK